MQPPIQAVLFDAGGTLVRTVRPVGEIYAEVALRYDQQWSGEALQQGFKQAWRTLKPRDGMAVPHDGDDRAWWKKVVAETVRVVDCPAQFPFDTYFEELYELFARPEMWQVYPEVVSVLQTLRARGYRLAVLSNWDKRLRTTLEGLDLVAYFEGMFISGELGIEKPSPAIYHHALEKLSLSPAQAMMVGDDSENDFHAPQRVGMKAVWIDRPGEDLQKVLGILP